VAAAASGGSLPSPRSHPADLSALANAQQQAANTSGTDAGHQGLGAQSLLDMSLSLSKNKRKGDAGRPDYGSLSCCMFPYQHHTFLAQANQLGTRANATLRSA
jgi:hypothetical protein